MSDLSRRRDRRYLVQLQVTMRQGNKSTLLMTENVSYRGLFLRTDLPPPLRQLVKIEAILPPHNQTFATHGMSVFVLEPGDTSAKVPGAGLQFYGMGDEKRMWESFINYIKPQSEDSPDTPVVAGPQKEDVPEPVRRKFERVPMVLEVKPTDVEELMRMYSRDVSAGGMFLATSKDLDPGTIIRLAIKHPKGEAVFMMEAIVRRRTMSPEPGFGVEFVHLSEGRRREFFDFVHTAGQTKEPRWYGV